MFQNLINNNYIKKIIFNGNSIFFAINVKNGYTFLSACCNFFIINFNTIQFNIIIYFRNGR